MPAPSEALIASPFFQSNGLSFADSSFADGRTRWLADFAVPGPFGTVRESSAGVGCSAGPDYAQLPTVSSTATNAQQLLANSLAQRVSNEGKRGHSL